MYFAIDGQDYSDLVSGMKVGYETLVSEDSGRNAAGDTVLDIVNRKIKLYINLRHTTGAEMSEFLSAIENFICEVSFMNPLTGDIETILAYTGTPEPEYYTLQPTITIFKPLEINFIQL